MKKLVLIVPFAVLAACGDGAEGLSGVSEAKVVQANGQLPAQPVPPKPRAVPFDVSAKSVGEDFTGHSCLEIAASLRKNYVFKDQYESTKEFNARISKLKDSPIYDDVSLGSQIVFVANEIGYEKYDADKGVLNFDAPYTSYNLTIGESHPMLKAYKKNKNERDYVGQNAYGAKANVKYQEEEVCVVTMANLPFEGLDKRSFKIKVAPDSARNLAGNIKTAYVGILIPPFISEYRSYQKAEMSRPYEVISKGDDIRFRLQQMIIFDRVTGEILGRKAFKQ